MKKFLISALLLLIAVSTVACNQKASPEPAADTSAGTSAGTSSDTSATGDTPSDPPAEPTELQKLLFPVWEGTEVYKETVMFLEAGEKAPLLYPIESVSSVTSFDEKTVYQEGVDYRVEDGKLMLLSGSSIPCIGKNVFYDVAGYTYQDYDDDGNLHTVYFGEGDSMAKWQIKVTYTHKESDAWGGYIPSNESAKFSNFLQKLQKGEDVTVFVYGDSITVGQNSSYYINVKPYMPSYSRLFVMHAAEKYGYTVNYVSTEHLVDTDNKNKHPGAVPSTPDVYGTNGTITYINCAIGGWQITNGINKFDAFAKPLLEQYGCDLAIIAFGMNDSSNSPTTEIGYQNTLLQKLQGVKEAEDTSVLWVSNMLPNGYLTETNQSGKFDTPLSEMVTSLRRDGLECGLARVTRMSKYLSEVKRFRDYTGNNVNHPNDFMHRIYAQTLIRTVFGD